MNSYCGFIEQVIKVNLERLNYCRLSCTIQVMDGYLPHGAITIYSVTIYPHVNINSKNLVNTSLYPLLIEETHGFHLERLKLESSLLLLNPAATQIPN